MKSLAKIKKKKKKRGGSEEQRSVCICAMETVQRLNLQMWWLFEKWKMLNTVICSFSQHFLSTILGKEVWPWMRQLAFGQLAGVGGHSSHQKTGHYFSVTHYKLEKYLQSVQSLSHVWLFATPWTAACQASLSITNSQSLPKPMSIESVMPSNHLTLCHLLLLLPSIFPSIRVFSNESGLRIRWPRMRWLDSTTDSMDVSLSNLREIVEDGGAWHATVHGVTKSRTQLSK